MPGNAKELWWSFIACLAITIVYLFTVNAMHGIPAASGLFGHSLGIWGFILMLMTETLYSLRKRSRNARWGRMSAWLQFHIFTGIVGPYMVLLHTSWKFNGLAGIVMLLTGLIVLSGFIGRYIYTSIPRTADGIEIEVDVLKQQIAELGSQATSLAGDQVGAAVQFSTAAAAGGLVLPAPRRPARELKGLLKRQKTLQRQVNSLAAARRLMSIWHMVHIPIGLALFLSAFIHAAAAIYYATLLR